MLTVRRARAARLLLLAVAVLLAGAVVLHPAVRAFGTAPLVLAGAVDAAVPHPFAPQVRRTAGTLGGVAVDRYSPGGGAPPVLVVPGAATAGRDDERLVAFATSLARAGRTVVVPELALYDRELDPADVQRVVEVAARLCPPDGGLVLFGFSYGGSLALVAAADERVAGCIDLVATFGAYADLVGVVQAAVTGVSVVDGRELPWEGADEDVVGEVVRDAAGRLVPEADREPLRRALDARDPAGLSPAARTVYDMVTTADPRRVPELAAGLPSPGAELVATFSPETVAGRIEARVLAIHAVDDPAVPYAELLRLGRAFPGAQLMTVRSFEHVDLAVDGDPGTVLRDLLVAWAFLHEVLRAQETWPWD